jgi:hypothetical protein
LAGTDRTPKPFVDDGAGWTAGTAAWIRHEPQWPGPTEESTPMSKWLMLPMVVLAYIATSATAAAPRDRDHDRLPDRWETKHHLSTAIPSAKRDPDSDHLNNRREFRLHTHPRRADTDRDGLRDGAEVRRFHTNPRKRGFPNRRTTGVPDGWVPAQTRSTDLNVTTPGAVVQDVLLRNGANLIVNANNVTIRRVKLRGGIITNQSGGCNPGTVIEDTTLERAQGGLGPDSNWLPAIGEGGYTARRVEIFSRGEGFRLSDCGRVTVEDSFVYIYAADRGTAACDQTHADGASAYHARGGTFHNNTLIFGTRCGTSPFYMGYSKPESWCAGKPHSSCPPNSNINTGTYNVDRMLVSGAGAVYRHQVPGSVTGLRIVDNSWVYFPIDNRCSVLGPWEAKIVDIDVPVTRTGAPSPDADYRVTRTVRDQPCDTEVVE